VAEKEEMHQVVPSIEKSFFPGKPITVDATGKDGFILEPADSGTHYTR